MDANSEPAVRGVSAQSDLRRVERRDWYLWVTAITSLLLVTAAVFAVAYPLLELRRVQDIASIRDLSIALRGLLGIVLTFCIFALYQQWAIKRLRREKEQHITEISQLRTRAEMFEKLAILDPLTAVFNRRFAEELLPSELARAERLGYPFTLLLLDLNNFKQLNEEHGHACGDAALREFAFELKKCIRSSDVPVRLGDDEFMVLLPECRSYHVPMALARLQGMRFEYNNTNIPITFAAGWSEFAVGESPEHLMDRATRELHSDKTTRRSVEFANLAQVQEQHTGKLQAIGQITGRVIHDFNNLLTVIRGYSELMMISSTLDEQNRLRADGIRQAADRAGQMTHQVLAYARKRSTVSGTVNMNQQIRECEGLLQKIVGDNVTLAVRLLADRADLQLHTGQIEQILLNLVANARDAIGNTKGIIRIETQPGYMDAKFVAEHPGSREGAYVSLIVSDNGCGMDADTRSKLFKPFFTRKEGRGAGLGLATVYGIIKQWSGYIDVTTAPGQGTTFTVYLPMAPPTAQSLPAPSGRLQSATILVVEPDAIVRELIRESLEAAGHSVVATATSAQALEIAAQRDQRIDAVVCDLVLRGVSCRDFTEAMLAARPDIRIVYLAGHEDAMAFDSLIAKGLFIEAPFSPAELDRTVAQALETPLRAVAASAD